MCGVLLMTLGARPTAQSKGDVALRAAMETETVKGDLKSAIEQYKQIAQGSDRALAAKALLRMAQCYQKLGDTQAQDVYKRLVRDYSDQPGAAEARARLAASDAPMTTLVWQKGEADEYEITSVSADGRYLGLTDWATGNLLVRDLATATNRIIVSANNPKAGQVDDDAEGSAISRDGTQVAYGWHEAKSERTELWVASLRGDAKPRRVYGDAAVAGIWPTDWSPDGKWIAFDRMNADGKQELALVSVEDGKARVLKIGYSARIVFSPDGKYVAYDLPQDATGARDVWVTDLHGATDSAVVTNRGNDVVMGWLPDGLLLVASDRTTTTELIGVAIRNGTVEGAPELLKADIGRTSPLGVTTAGALFYSTGLETCCGSIQVAEFDPRSGRVTSRRDVSTNLQENMSTRVGHRMASTSLTFRYVIGRAARESS